VLAPLYPLSTLSISSVSRCPETGVFRVVFDAGDVEVSADLSICWYEYQNLAFLRFIEVDHVRTRDAALATAVEAWVKANDQVVFAAALEAA
jgi:hypothetical protein